MLHTCIDTYIIHIRKCIHVVTREKILLFKSELVVDIVNRDVCIYIHMYTHKQGSTTPHSCYTFIFICMLYIQFEPKMVQTPRSNSSEIKAKEVYEK